jgi:hypothetical protein
VWEGGVSDLRNNLIIYSRGISCRARSEGTADHRDHLCTLVMKHVAAVKIKEVDDDLASLPSMPVGGPGLGDRPDKGHEILGICVELPERMAKERPLLKEGFEVGQLCAPGTSNGEVV